MKDLLIYANMGLGDAIILNGLVRKLAEARDKVIFLCKSHNCESVRFMFGDNPKIIVEPVGGDAGAEMFISDVEVAAARATNPWEIEIMRLGCTGPGWTTGQDFDQTFYRQAGVPFEERWSGFYAPPSNYPMLPLRLELGARYLLAHEDASRGYVIDRTHLGMPAESVPVIFTDTLTPNIFDWVPALTNASEIHCIPSSFSVLWDSGPDIKQKLFLHASARPGGELPSYRKNWKIL